MGEANSQTMALFRYQIIAPLLCIREKETLQGAIKRLSENSYQVPDSPYPRKFAFKTIEQWFYAYKKGGLEFLKRVERRDCGESKAIRGEVAEAVVEMLTNKPQLDAPTVLKELVARELIKEGEVSLSSIYRFRKARGLKKSAKKTDCTYRAFEFAYPQDCFQTDVLFGPQLSTKDGKRRKTYLIAVIDDCTRVITHGQFYFEQNLPTFLDTLKQAIMKRGLPKRLYLDNALVFRSSKLLRITATLGIHLIHSKPYRPEGRAKIERFFRTVRTQFLQRVDEKTIADIEELNSLFWAWLEGEYHIRKHRTLKEAPLDKWLRLSTFTRELPLGIDLDRVFMHEVERRVSLDGTLQLNKCRFEAPIHLIGQKVKVYYDPSDLRKIYLASESQQQEDIAYPVDLEANSRVRRESPEEKPKPQTHSQPLVSLEQLKKSMEENNGFDNSPAN